MDALSNKFKIVSKDVTLSATANTGLTASIDFTESGYTVFALQRIQSNRGQRTRLCSFWIEGSVGKAYFETTATETVTVYMDAIMMKS